MPGATSAMLHGSSVDPLWSQIGPWYYCVEIASLKGASRTRKSQSTTHGFRSGQLVIRSDAVGSFQLHLADDDREYFSCGFQDPTWDNSC